MTIEKVRVEYSKMVESLKEYTTRTPNDTYAVMELEERQIILDALNKQIPVKAIDDPYSDFACPVCKFSISMEGGLNFKHCPECGQKIQR